MSCSVTQGRGNQAVDLPGQCLGRKLSESHSIVGAFGQVDFVARRDGLSGIDNIVEGLGVAKGFLSSKPFEGLRVAHSQDRGLGNVVSAREDIQPFAGLHTARSQDKGRGLRDVGSVRLSIPGAGGWSVEVEVGRMGVFDEVSSVGRSDTGNVLLGPPSGGHVGEAADLVELAVCRPGRGGLDVVRRLRFRFNSLDDCP